LTDQQSDPDCNEGSADSDEGAALPGAPDCQKDDADGEEHGARSPGCRRNVVRFVGHAPNGMRLCGERIGAERGRCSALFGGLLVCVWVIDHSSLEANAEEITAKACLPAKDVETDARTLGREEGHQARDVPLQSYRKVDALLGQELFDSLCLGCISSEENERRVSIHEVGRFDLSHEAICLGRRTACGSAASASESCRAAG
jgi:hypothetical protein